MLRRWKVDIYFEAEVVRMVFRMTDEGANLSQLAQALQEQDILSPRGKATWSREVLRKISRNEKYAGTVVLQKTFVADCLEHKQIKNTDQLDQYKINGNHDAKIEKILCDLIP